MKAKLDKTKYLKDLYVKMTATVTAQRDVAWQWEDQLQLEKLELAHHLDTVNDLAMQYRDIAFDLYHQLHPPPGEGEMDTDGELADDGEPDQGLSDEEESDSGDDNPRGDHDDGDDDPGYSSGHTD
jgi:hypothetical protein